MKTPAGAWSLDDGVLTIDQREIESSSVWVANSGDNTVSKLDQQSGVELARYNSGGLDPSRTAVDQEFNAYVANRDGISTVTKYADKIEKCVDRDSPPNGIQTSTGSTVVPEDECILWTTQLPLADASDDARALAVGKLQADGNPGLVWVGSDKTRQAIALDPLTGAVVTTIALRDETGADFIPYGAATGQDGRIWFVAHWPKNADSDRLGYINPEGTTFQTVEGIPDPRAVGYGISIDPSGNVYIAHAKDGAPPGENNAVFTKYNPETEEWTEVSLFNPGTLRGVGADFESLWVAVSDVNRDSYNGGADRVLQFQLSNLQAAPTVHNLDCGHPVGVSACSGDRFGRYARTGKLLVTTVMPGVISLWETNRIPIAISVDSD